MITRSQRKSQKPMNLQTHHPISTLKNCRVVVEKLDIKKHKNPNKENIDRKMQCKVVLQDLLQDPKAISSRSKPPLHNDYSINLFSKCDSARCQLKSHFSQTNDIVSSCTMRSYKSVIPRGVVKSIVTLLMLFIC